jgi:hypothetical protein
VDELDSRFGSGSEERHAQMDELRQFIDAVRAAGVARVMVNGSFVTGKRVPNDVDVVILPGPDYPREQPWLDGDELVWPFLQIIVAADNADFESWAAKQFSTDRKSRAKGVVEVVL